MIQYRNLIAEFNWINNFIKMNYKDSKFPMIRVARMVRNSMKQIKELEKKNKELEARILKLETRISKLESSK